MKTTKVYNVDSILDKSGLTLSQRWGMAPIENIQEHYFEELISEENINILTEDNERIFLD